VPDGPYLVLGLGRAGQAAAKALAELAGPGAVHASDSGSPLWAQREIAALRRSGVDVRTSCDGTDFFGSSDRPGCVIKSPGVPVGAPALRVAAEAGVPVLDELELGWRLSAAPLVAITGTNGKSTTSGLIAAMHEAAGARAPLVGNGEFGQPLSAAAAARCDRLVCEVSSFQLEGSPAMVPEAAVLTNLRNDHLDRHRTMRRYAACKRRLFVRGERTTRLAVLPADDRFGTSLARELSGGDVTVLRFGCHRGAEFRLTSCDWTARSGRLLADTPDGSVELEHRLPGEHNAMNVLAAVAAARGLGIAWDAIAAALARTPGVPGRFETVDAGQPFDVIVDFTQTPDAVEGVLRAGRVIAARRGGRVLALVSTSGHRPPMLSPLIGEATARLADLVVVTAGSLRAARVEDVVGPVADGARSAAAGRVEVEPDRRLAIRRVLEAARQGDFVAILGRGARATLSTHVSAEDGTPFDDRQVAREEIERLLSGRASQAATATMRA
jgi:UDP-N-acetylmuramoyl-L-alanyl-D-glutamate--2,6-diaminopimelate ligase